MSELELKFAPTSTVSASAKGVFSGYGAVFNNIDSFGDIIAKGAFANSLANHAVAGTQPVLLWSHNQAQPAGKFTAMREDEKGLFIEGQLNLETEAGRKAYSHLKNGDVTGLSIGYRVVSSKETEDDLRDLLELDVQEISIVSIPANPKARITGVKSNQNSQDLTQLLAKIEYSTQTFKELN